MTFTLPSGNRVRVFHMGGGELEFVTSNAAGDVVSTVRRSGVLAEQTMRALEANAR